MDTGVISIPWLLRIMLLWTCEHRLTVMISFLGYPTPRPHTSSGPWPVGNQGEVSGHLPQNQSLYQNSFRYIPRGRNAGSCGSSVFSFVRKLHSGFSSLPTEQQCACAPCHHLFCLILKIRFARGSSLTPENRIGSLVLSSYNTL